jgi:hypothetical protein
MNNSMHWTTEELQKLKESYENKETVEAVLKSIDGRSEDSVKRKLHKLIKSENISKRTNFIRPHIQNPIYTRKGIINGSNKIWWTTEEKNLLREQWLSGSEFNIEGRSKRTCNSQANRMGLYTKKRIRGDETEVANVEREKRQKKEAAKATKAEREAAKEKREAERKAERAAEREVREAEKAAKQKTEMVAKMEAARAVIEAARAEMEAAKKKKEADKKKKEEDKAKKESEIIRLRHNISEIKRLIKESKSKKINWWTKEEIQKLLLLTNAKTPIHKISTEFPNRSARAIGAKQYFLRKRGMLEEESLVGNWSDDDFDNCVDNCGDNCVDDCGDNCVDDFANILANTNIFSNTADFSNTIDSFDIFNDSLFI